MGSAMAQHTDCVHSKSSALCHTSQGKTAGRCPSHITVLARRGADRHNPSDRLRAFLQRSASGWEGPLHVHEARVQH